MSYSDFFGVFSCHIFCLDKNFSCPVHVVSFQLHDNGATCTLSFSPLWGELHSCDSTEKVADCY